MGIISARSSRIPTLCQELLELDYEEHRQCDTSSGERRGSRPVWVLGDVYLKRMPEERFVRGSLNIK